MGYLLLKESFKIFEPFERFYKRDNIRSGDFSDELFVDLLGYIQENFSLDYICLKDIWEDDENEGYEVLDQAGFDKEDIGKGLSTLKFNILRIENMHSSLNLRTSSQ
jgi:hypothetical protein